jgi:hypothetical protein
VYLADVAVDGSDKNEAQYSWNWRQAFRNSRWFRRGWTLQELIAPKIVDFFDSNGKPLGDKTFLMQEIHQATKLPSEALTGRSLEEFSVEARLSWAKGRETKREEDAVYSLLGIFDIYMPLIYGEGRQRAFRRLMKELQDLTSTGQPSNSPQFFARYPQQTRAATLPVAHVSTSASKNMSTYERYDPIEGGLQSGVATVMPMWPGNIIRTRCSEPYLQRRDIVSNAAYQGIWTDVLENLEIAMEEYGENWSNVVRLSMKPTRPTTGLYLLMTHRAPSRSQQSNMLDNLTPGCLHASSSQHHQAPNR